jgi:hypothetical protein
VTEVQRSSIRPRRRSQSLLGLLVVAIYAPAVTSVGLQTDVAAHLTFAEKIALLGPSFGSPYLFEQSTIIVRALIPFGELAALFPSLGDRQTTWDISGVVVIVAFVVAAALLVQRRLVAAGQPRPWPPDSVALVATLGAMVAAPVTVLTWSDHHLLLGYISVPAYENASLNVLKPFALLLFWAVLDRLSHRDTPWRTVAFVALLSILAVHAKPSFTVCFLPVIAVLALWKQRFGTPPNWRLLTWGLAVPSVLYSLTQYASFAEGAGIRIAPLEVVGDLLDVHGRPEWWVFPLLALSVVYPLGATIAYWPRARRSLTLMTAWAVTGIGVALFLLLQITGRTDYGDLVGGAQIGVFLLFVEATLLTVVTIADHQDAAAAERRRLSLTTRDTIVLAAFTLQVLCGAFLWYREVVSPAEWW